MQEEDRQKCGVLSVEGRKFDQEADARRNSQNNCDDANIPGSKTKLDLDQKKLLCGSKRLFN